MTRHLRPQPRHDILLRLPPPFHPRRRHDIRARHLRGLIFAVHADDSNVVDLRMAEQQALKLRGRDLEAFVLDQLLDAVGDVEVAVLVLVPDVAGLEVAVRGQGVRGAFGVAVVALEDVGALHPQLAYLAGGHFGFLGGHVFRGHVRE